LQGVRGVLNQIKLNPTASPEGVKSRIEQALQRHADVKSAKIKVNSNNGKVILDGHIDSLFERAAVNNVAWSAPGVLEVVDRLLS
jgi:hyperosmotically inducible protein